MLEDALAYPRRGDDVWKRHLIGGALMLLSIFFFPIFFVYGYLVRVVRKMAAGDSEPPTWDAWDDLFIDGIKYFVVSLLYGLPATFLGGLIALFAGGLVVSLMGDAPGLTLTFAAIVAVLGLVTAIVGLLAGYLLPAAIVNFVLVDDIAAAVHFRTIIGNAFTRPYAAAWLKTIGVGIVLGLVGTVLLIVLVGFLVFFYLTIVGTYLLTEGYLEAAGHEPA